MFEPHPCGWYVVFDLATEPDPLGPFESREDATLVANLLGGAEQEAMALLAHAALALNASPSIPVWWETWHVLTGVELGEYLAAKEAVPGG